MKMDPAWWTRASDRDLGMAQGLRELGFYEGAAFHCQQAAEKILKAAVLVRGGATQRTYSCTELLEFLADLGLPVPGEIATQARKLDLHYVDSRYPNGVGGAPDKFYDRNIADEAIAACQAIREFAAKGLER